MSHTLELSAALRDQLWTTAPAIIEPVVKFTGSVKLSTGQNADGSYNFASTYSDVVDYDLSALVDRENPPKFAFQKPFFPVDGDESFLQASEVKLSLLNPLDYIGVVQTGSIFNPDEIERGVFTISAKIGSSGLELQVFKGRIFSTPREERSRTVFTLIDTFWEAMSAPVLFENFGLTQDSYVDRWGDPVHDFFTVGNDTSGLFFNMFDAYITFSPDSREEFTTSRDAKGTIDVLNIKVLSRARLGEYTIRFETSTRFTLSYPDGKFKRGDRNEDFSEEKIEILSEDWTGTAEPGDEIIFSVTYSAYGNPVSIAKNLLEKAFANNWGSLPGLNVTQWPVDWAAFDTLEKQFRASLVYFSETNTDNTVWQRSGGDGPFNCLQGAQRCLDHIGATLIVNENNKVSVIGPYLGDPSTIYDVTAEYPLIDYVFDAATRYNVINSNYGLNLLKDSFSEVEETDIGTVTTQTATPKTLNYRYFKSGESEFQLLNAHHLVINKYLNTPNQIPLTVVPAFAISARPGDRYRIVSGEKPQTVGIYLEVLETRFSFGESSKLICRRVRDAEGVLPTTTNFVACESYAL